QEFSPAIDKWITEYLTPNCAFNAMTRNGPGSLYNVELHNTGFVEEAIDVPLILNYIILFDKLILFLYMPWVSSTWFCMPALLSSLRTFKDDSILWQQPFTNGFKEQERSEIS
ncbi:19744_t:CDS:2, partial [Gigaspora rosea]